MHYKREFAQFASVRLGRGQPLLQACLVHVLQAARAVARGQQRIQWVTLAMAYPTNIAAVLRRLTAARSVSAG